MSWRQGNRNQASRVTANKYSNRTDNSRAHIHLTVFPVSQQRAEPDGRKQNQKRRALRKMLIHAQQIDHRRHENHSAADSQKPHKHADAKPQEQDKEDHRETASLFPSLFVATVHTAYIFLVLTERRNAAFICRYTKETRVFLFQRNLLYLCVSSHQHCGLLDPLKH